MKKIGILFVCTVLCMIGGFLLASASGIFGEVPWFNSLAAKPLQGAFGLFLAATGCFTYRVSAWL